MTVHKLTAGDGYTYLTQQVAAHDVTNRGHESLGSYYSEKGEAPGVWVGTGLSAMPQLVQHPVVREAQMRALFGEGRHPNADEIEQDARRAGASVREIDRASRLGAKFRVDVRANEFAQRSARAFRDYNKARDRPGDTPIDAGVRASLRTDLATAMFTETFGRAPADARELSGHLARISRPATTAVAGYDLTFSPVKSVSALWALAPRDVAEQIERAHADAVADTLGWLERNAAYTRRGKNGVAQVDVRGLIAAAFTHRDSRAGDPDLHTHVAVSNKVQATDGTWLTLDGRLLFRNNVAASERYNTRLEALLTDRLGVTFADRPQPDPSKRPVREIVGVDGPLPARWSARRAKIDAGRAVLTAAFQADHGRPPTPAEAIALAQRANLESRPDKHPPRSHAEQRATWRAEAASVLGGEQQLDGFLTVVLTGRPGRTPAPTVDSAWVALAADAVVGRVSAGRASWQIHHIRAEAERHARTAGVRLADVDRAVEGVISAALEPGRSLPLDTGDPRPPAALTPADLLRRDGSSVFTVAGATLYTSARVLAAERALVAAAGLRDGRRVGEQTVSLALLESAANGTELNPGQVQMVRDLASSGARVQLALAPAGTGKTTAMRALARAWTTPAANDAADGVGGTVLGLAPSAAAAAVLREEIGGDADTLAKLLHALDTCPVETTAAASVGPVPAVVPGWVSGIGPGTLVIIDEAGMAGTPQLAQAVEFVLARGGSVRLVGDDQQLAAIGAGGVLRDIARTHGAVTLSQVVRFTHPPGHRLAGRPNRAEGAASLALRDGDPAAVAFYLDHDRVHVGDLTTATDQAYTAWQADRTAGRDAIMLAPTRELVFALNNRARVDRLAHHASTPVAVAGSGTATVRFVRPVDQGREVLLADTSRASAGDTIITRRNNRRIPITATDWVKNGDRWTVLSVDEGGGLQVRHLRTGRQIPLPADYVAAHVTLGYASTVHGAQGITADTAHTVAAGTENRQLLYVALTRGRHANHLYLTTAGDGDPHSVITRDALIPPTAGDLLARALARDGAPVSATTQAATLAEPGVRLAAAAGRYQHALAVVDDDALDAGLCARIRTDGPAVGPLPWLPAVPAGLAADASWGPFLADQAALIRLSAGQLTDQVAGWTPASAPAWAAGLFDQARQSDPTLLVDLALWRAATAVPDHDRRPAGPPVRTWCRTGDQPGEHSVGIGETRAHADLQRRILRILGAAGGDAARWQSAAVALDPRITVDSYWPTLAEQLAAADRAGLPARQLLAAAARARPLPDEQPAAALWWRLADHLTPAAVSATGDSRSERLTPTWTPVLADVLGPEAAARVQADPAWPALVAAITTATATASVTATSDIGGAASEQWTAGQLLATAHQLLGAGQSDGQPLRPDELATALVWRISALTDPTAPPDSNGAESSDAPGDPLDLLVAAPVDLDRLAAADVADADREEAWRALLTEPAPDQMIGTLADGPAGTPTPAAPTPPAPAADRQRLLELNALAADFYASQYATSWAPSYLAGRLGADPAGDPRIRVGYAPDGWTALVDHLRAAGATDAEMVAAGLGSQARTGRVIDRFRDRLVFPIRHAALEPAADPSLANVEVCGFIGRRNPRHDQLPADCHTGRPAGGPKYLNTAETAVFTKGRELYGLAENAAGFAAGATPVLVEGPVDAIAVTLASGGRYVGVAPMGTTLSDHQADLIHGAAHASDTPRDVLVATDNDPAGRRAADADYWKLTDRRLTPRRPDLPAGADPADLAAAAGTAALTAALDDALPLAGLLVEDRIRPWAGQFDTPDGRVGALYAAVPVITALPQDQWAEPLARLVAATGIDPTVAIDAVLDAATTGSGASSDRQAAPGPARPEPDGPVHAPGGPAERWAEVAERLVPAITADPEWPELAEAIGRAQATGFDPARLEALVETAPLKEPRARNLEYRLANAWAGSVSPADRLPDPAAAAQPRGRGGDAPSPHLAAPPVHRGRGR